MSSLAILHDTYPLQKFDSDTERRFAILLERDALKWFNPPRGN